jgi:hypothetical protein
MSNALNKDLTGKTVWVETSSGELRAFICEDGFGCKPTTNGQKIYGHWEALDTSGRPCGKADMIFGRDVVREL